MLIPFLDIMCSLIGVLILIIVVVSIAQTQKAQGRTRQELALAQKLQELLAKQKLQEQADTGLAAKITALDKLNQEIQSRQKKIEELRKQIAQATQSAGANKDEAAKLQKQIDDLLRQIEPLAKSIPPVQAEVEVLRKKLAELQKKLDDKAPSVIVRPSGSGSKGGNQRLFFVEASGAGIIVHKSKTEQLRVARDSVGVDTGYNAFLQTVKNTPNSSLIFLVRKDGWSSFVRAAGWAEQSCGLTTGKLPIPGDGAVDLSLFGEK